MDNMTFPSILHWKDPFSEQEYDLLHKTVFETKIEIDKNVPLFVHKSIVNYSE